MKLSLIALSAFAGIVLGSTVAVAGQADVPVAASHPILVEDFPALQVEVPSPAQPKFAAAKKVAVHARTWACGDWRPTALGTVVRDCEWK